MADFFRKRKTWISSAHQGFVEDCLHPNTLAAYALAARKGADMIETDARTTKDGVLVAHHDPDVKGFDESGRPVRRVISETDFAEIAHLSLRADNHPSAHVPTLEQTLNLAYFSGMCVNIDLKEARRADGRENLSYVERIARMAVCCGMRGRVVYATNGAGAEAIRKILAIDSEARFIDTKQNFTKAALANIEDAPARCYVFTSDFSDENIAEIRESGCMLAAISLNDENANAAFRHHPDMAEYPHTSDFEAIDERILRQNGAV